MYNSVHYVDPLGLDPYDVAAVFLYQVAPVLAAIAVIAGIVWGLSKLFGGGKGKGSHPDLSALLQDTGERFPLLQSPLARQGMSHLTQLSATISAGLQTVGDGIDAFAQSEAYRNGQTIAQDLGVSAGRAADVIGRQLIQPAVGPAASRLINYLADIPAGKLGAPDLIGASPGALQLDSDLRLLRPRTLRSFRGSGTALSLALTVNEVINTYRIPDSVLTFDQRDERAKIQAVGGLSKVLAGMAIGAIVGSWPTIPVNKKAA